MGIARRDGSGAGGRSDKRQRPMKAPPPSVPRVAGAERCYFLILSRSERGEKTAFCRAARDLLIQLEKWYAVAQLDTLPHETGGYETGFRVTLPRKGNKLSGVQAFARIAERIADAGACAIGPYLDEGGREMGVAGSGAPLGAKHSAGARKRSLHKEATRGGNLPLLVAKLGLSPSGVGWRGAHPPIDSSYWAGGKAGPIPEGWGAILQGALPEEFPSAQALWNAVPEAHQSALRDICYVVSRAYSAALEAQMYFPSSSNQAALEKEFQRASILREWVTKLRPIQAVSAPQEFRKIPRSGSSPQPGAEKKPRYTSPTKFGVGIPHQEYPNPVAPYAAPPLEKPIPLPCFIRFTPPGIRTYPHWHWDGDGI